MLERNLYRALSSAFLFVVFFYFAKCTLFVGGVNQARKYSSRSQESSSTKSRSQSIGEDISLSLFPSYYNALVQSVSNSNSSLLSRYTKTKEDINSSVQNLIDSYIKKQDILR